MNGSKLPIHAFRDQIVEAVRTSPVVVITAETGAGKSTQVPQYLLDEGYDLVVTQPRRLAVHPGCATLIEVGEFGGEGTVIVADPDRDVLLSAMRRHSAPSMTCLTPTRRFSTGCGASRRPSGSR